MTDKNGEQEKTRKKFAFVRLCERVHEREKKERDSEFMARRNQILFSAGQLLPTVEKSDLFNKQMGF